jgi:hypothetical protein
MLFKTLPLLLLCACVSTAQLPVANQPGFAELAQSYAPQLRAVGITQVVSPGNGAMVRLETGYGSVYLPYPSATDPKAFVLDISADGLRASAPTFDRAKDERMLAALVPEAVRATTTNNRLAWLHANPWH